MNISMKEKRNYLIIGGIAYVVGIIVGVLTLNNILSEFYLVLALFLTGTQSFLIARNWTGKKKTFQKSAVKEKGFIFELHTMILLFAFILGFIVTPIMLLKNALKLKKELDMNEVKKESSED